MHRGVVEQVRGAALDPAEAAVAVAPAREHVLGRCGVLEQPRVAGGDPLAVVGMDVLHQPGAGQRLGAMADHILDRRGLEANRAVPVHDRDHVGGVVDQAAVPRRGLAGEDLEQRALAPQRPVVAPAGAPVQDAERDGRGGREGQAGGGWGLAVGAHGTGGRVRITTAARVDRRARPFFEPRGTSPLQSGAPKVGFPSGQRGRAVNPLAQPSQVRILLPPYDGARWRGG